MKRFLLSAVIVTTAGFTVPINAADVGVSITIGQPGYYGRLDVDNYPRPRLLYAQPVLIEHVHPRAPIYMRVPPGHAKTWKKHCREYGACEERVFFVRDDWYRQEYVPRYQKRHGDNQDKYRGNKHSVKNHGQGHQR